MPVVTGTGLQNASDIADAVRAALSAQGWTTVVNEGTVGSNDKEIWMHLPAVNTFLGYDMLFGMKSMNTSPTEDPGRMRILMSYLNPTDALIDGSPRNDWDRVLGVHNKNPTLTVAGASRATGQTSDVYPSQVSPPGHDTFTLATSGAARPCTLSNLDTPANYLNHWIITPNNSPLGSSEQYVYVVVETEAGVFRSFALGEGEKLGGGAWNGGLFIDVSYVEAGGNETQNRWLLGGDALYNSFNSDRESGFILNFDNFNMNFDSPRQWNPWVWMGDGTGIDEISAVGMGPRALGRDMLTRSPSAFSGQAIRLPARFYVQDNPDSLSTGLGISPSNLRNNWRPLMEAPDFFHTNIEAFANAEVVVDDTERFIVFPYFRRSGVDNTGNFGFMIRHPDL